jgi:serine/threonine protein kinase
MRTTNTASSRLTTASTTASSPLSLVDQIDPPVYSLRINRRKKTCEDIPEYHIPASRYYKAVISQSGDTWDMLSDYTDCELIGRGSYGEVVRAVHSESSSRVAIKRVEILEDGESSDWENGLRLLREIHFLKEMTHPNLAKLISVFPNNPGTHTVLLPDTIFIVTEYFSSGCLNGYNPQNLSEIISIQSQIMCGLDYLHKHNILHRDIKRENIFVRSGSTPGSVNVVIGDFGLARSVSYKMTSEVVTKPYRCPLLVLGETTYGPEIDVYASGIVLAEMLIGKLNNTLLPIRKMGVKNFLRYQLHLAGVTDIQQVGDHVLSLAECMHLDLEELVYGNDYDDQVVCEWSRQSWANISRGMYGEIPSELQTLLRRMIAIDPTVRPKVTEVIDVLRQTSCRRVTRSSRLSSIVSCPNASESFDAQIAPLGSDDLRAKAVKKSIADLIAKIHSTHTSPQTVHKRRRGCLGN